MKKTKVAVLMGGKSPEHDISLITGREVLKYLPKKHSPLPVVISRDGKRWKLRLKNGKSKLIDLAFLQKNVDVCFVALHGPYGEDGTIQGLLDMAGIPYTGSGVLASALGMNKLMFGKIMKAESVKYPQNVVSRKSEKLSRRKAINFPCVVKPHNQGSSVGISIVKLKKDLNKALKKAHKYSDTVLIEEYIDGLELTCGVLGNNNPTALPLVEIHPISGEFFDYESKYTESGAEEIVPARISKSLTKKIQKIAIQVHLALGCKGFSRVDFILRNKLEPVVLEINTIPGLTPESLLPKAAKVAGFSYPQMLGKMIYYAKK